MPNSIEGVEHRSITVKDDQGREYAVDAYAASGRTVNIDRKVRLQMTDDGYKALIKRHLGV